MKGIELKDKEDFKCRLCGKRRLNYLKSREDDRYCKMCMGEVRR